MEQSSVIQLRKMNAGLVFTSGFKHMSPGLQSWSTFAHNQYSVNIIKTPSMYFYIYGALFVKGWLFLTTCTLLCYESSSSRQCILRKDSHKLIIRKRQKNNNNKEKTMEIGKQG